MSAFRFVTSNRRSQYSVWSGDTQIGYITKIVHRVTERGLPRTIVSGWRPSTIACATYGWPVTDFAIEKTRDAAAQALWNLRTKHR